MWNSFSLEIRLNVYFSYQQISSKSNFMPAEHKRNYEQNTNICSHVPSGIFISNFFFCKNILSNCLTDFLFFIFHPSLLMHSNQKTLCHYTFTTFLFDSGAGMTKFPFAFWHFPFSLHNCCCLLRFGVSLKICWYHKFSVSTQRLFCYTKQRTMWQLRIWMRVRFS